MEDVDFKSLKGKTLKKVIVDTGNDNIIFECTDNSKYRMFHNQSCCESVVIESIVGDLNDLIGNPILLAETRVSSELDEGQEYEESFTWTFYEIRNIKASCQIRWFGSSNGYYSESVNFRKLTDTSQ